MSHDTAVGDTDPVARASRRAALVGGVGAALGLATASVAQAAPTDIGDADEDRPFINIAAAPYNAVLDGTTDNSTVIQQAIDDHPNGATLYFPAGVCIASNLALYPSFRLLGDSANRSILRSPNGPLFNSVRVVRYCVFSNMSFEATGGDVFAFHAKGVSRTVWEYCILKQGSPDHSIISSTGTGALFIDTTMIGCDLFRVAESTVPAVLLTSSTSGVNSNRWLYSRINCAEADAYFFHLEAGACNDNVFTDLTFEQPTGGAIKVLSAVGLTVTNCAAWDSRTPWTNHLYHVGRKEGGVLSKSLVFINSGRRDGNAVDGIFDIHCAPDETEHCVVVNANAEHDGVLGTVNVPETSVVIGTGAGRGELRAGSLGIGNVQATSRFPGAVVGIFEVFDMAGNSAGYVPLYSGPAR